MRIPLRFGLLSFGGCQSWLTAVAVLWAAPSPAADTGTVIDVASPQLRWQVDATGHSRLLRINDGARDWVAANARGAAAHPFSSVTLKGETYLLTSLAAQPGTADLFDATFGTSGIRAVFRIAAKRGCIVVELVQLDGPRPEKLCLLQVAVDAPEHLGAKANVRWNQDAVFCVMGLSDRVETRPLGTTLLTATLHAEFGFEGQKVAFIGTTPSQFYSIVEQVEMDFGLPCPRLDGQWAKTSEDARGSYLFTDLKYDNVEETIRRAKLGNFRYILVYTTTWSSSRGTYPIHKTNYPGGEEQLKQVIDQCHAAGLKVGMHMLCNFVSKNDPLVRPKPDPRLYKDARAELAVPLDEGAASITAKELAPGFSRAPARRGRPGGLTIQIDDELITYAEIGGPNGTTFLRCTRGAHGTKAAAHAKGAAIHHLAELANSFLADIRTNLKDQISDRISGLINRCGFDMIYVDGGNGTRRFEPEWYWMSQLQHDMFRKVTRELLVEGNAITPFTWHWCTRGVCDDYAALDPIAYLDVHKMRRYREHAENFMPAELGWWGFVAERSDHPTTTPREVEYHAVRMLGLDAPISFETSLEAMQRHGGSEELMGLLGRYERLRLSHAVPDSLRMKLRTGEWTLSEQDGRRAFVPLNANEGWLAAGQALRVDNQQHAQPLRFRLEIKPVLKPYGDPTNVKMTHGQSLPIFIAPPAPSAGMPGALAHRIAYAEAAAGPDVYLVSADDSAIAGQKAKGINLTAHRALGVRLRVSGTPITGQPPPVLNIQLESPTDTYRDHFIDLDFEGERTVVIPESSFGRLMREFHDVDEYYLPKSAAYTFSYSSVAALNIRWMRAPANPRQRIEIHGIEALCETNEPLRRPSLVCSDAQSVMIPADLKPGDSVEADGSGELRIYDSNGRRLKTLRLPGPLATLGRGISSVRLQTSAPAATHLRVEIQGKAERF